MLTLARVRGYGLGGPRKTPTQARQPGAMRSNPVVDRATEQAADKRNVEERDQPPQSGHPQHDVAVGLEAWQGSPVGEGQIECLFEPRIGDNRRRMGAEVANA